MIHTLLIPLVLAGTVPEPPEPVDPDLEVAIVVASFPEEACAPMRQIIDVVAVALGRDEQTATDMVIAYGVELYENGPYGGQNLTAEGEDALIGMFEGCLLNP